MNLVCDTSILIYKLRGGKKWDEFVAVIGKDAELFLPSIVVFELYSGQSSKDKEVEKNLRRVVGYFEVVELTRKISKIAGEIYRDQAKDLEVPDYIVAATALEMDAEVVTLNKKHFVNVKGLRIFDM